MATNKQELREEFVKWFKFNKFALLPSNNKQVKGCSNDIADFWLSKREAEFKEMREKIEYQAHFSKLAGSKYDGYMDIKQVLSIIDEKLK
jgi:hypothetical protein